MTNFENGTRTIMSAIISFLNCKDFWLGAFSAFFGAWVAFKLQAKRENDKEKNTNIHNLNNLMIVLTHHLQKICALKIQFIDSKRKVLIKIKKHNTISESDKKDIGIQIASSFGKDFDTNDILFLIKNEPNLYLNILLYFDSLQSLEILLDEYNKFISKDHNDGQFFIEGNVHRIRALKKEIASSIQESAKCITNLTIYGKDYFGKDKIIGIEFPNKIQQIIDAIPINKNLYTVKQRTFIQKHFPLIERMFKNKGAN